MTKSLTEQWREGELGFGYYYIDFGIGGVPMLFNGLEFYCERTQKPNAIKTILAPVPSYDHFSQLVKMVERLQEQLKEANDVIKGYADAYKKYPDGTMMTFFVNKHPAHHYLDKWGIK